MTMIESPYQASAGHIEIDGLSLRIVGDINGQSEVGSAEERRLLLDVPAIFADCSGGMGATDRYIMPMYGDGEFIDTFSCPGVVLPAGELVEITNGFIPYDAGLTGAFEYGADLYLCAGRPIYKVPGGTGTSVSLVHDVGLGVTTAGAVIFNGAAYIGVNTFPAGVPDKLVKFDGSTFTEHSTVPRRHLAVVLWAPTGTPAWTLIGTTSSYQVRWCTADPTVDANWAPASPGHPIGDSFYHIRSLVASPRHVYFGKQEGVFDLDERGIAPNLTPHWRHSYDIENGAATAILDEYIYSGHVYGLERVAVTGERQDIPEPCGPGVGLPYSGPIYGRCTALATWKGWLIAAFHNQDRNKSYICFGKDRRHAGIDGPGPMVWHGAYTVVDGYVTLLKVHTPPIPGEDVSYLWIGTAYDVYHLYRQSLPKTGNAYQSLLHGGPHRFSRESSITFPDGWPEHPTGSRSVWQYAIEAQRMTGAPNIMLKANLDGEDADGDGEPDYTEQGWTSRNGLASFLAPRDLGAAARITFKLELSGTEESPPVFLSLRARADINFQLSDIRTYTVDLRADQDAGIGTPEVRSAYARLVKLKRLTDYNAVQVTVRDELNMTWQASLLQVDWVERLADQDDVGFIAKLVVRFLYRSIRYNAGDSYNEGNPYG